MRRGAAKGAETPEAVGEGWGGEGRVRLGAARAGDPKAVYALHGPCAPRAVPEEFSRGIFPSRQSVSAVSSPQVYAKGDEKRVGFKNSDPCCLQTGGAGRGWPHHESPEASLRAGGAGGGGTGLRTLVKRKD